MQLHSTTDVEAYAAAVAAFLDAEPRARVMLRGVIDSARRGGIGWTAPPCFWWAGSADGAVAAASWSPPHWLLVSTLPAGVARPLIDSALERARHVGRPLEGVFGPRSAAEAVARCWQDATGGTAVERFTLLFHELDGLREPARPPGSWRLANAGDVDRCTELWTAFASETGASPGADVRGAVARTVEDRLLFLWQVDGTPVCMVRCTPTAGVVRVGPVYTVPEHRGRGCGSRLTYEATREALTAPGATSAVLFTDAANPISNSIYRRIGFRPTGEHADLTFRTAGSTAATPLRRTILEPKVQAKDRRAAEC